MALNEHFARRHLLVEKSLQFKYMIVVLFTILAISGVIVLTVYFTHWSLLSQHHANSQTKTILDEIFRTFNMFLAFEIPLMLLAAAFVSIVVSHKVAGPVYRLQKVASKVAKGDLTCVVRLRHDDELKNLSSAFNSVIDNMHLLVAKDRKLIFELSRVTDTLYTDLKDKKINENEALILIRKLNDLIGELKTLIMQYKIEKS